MEITNPGFTKGHLFEVPFEEFANRRQNLSKQLEESKQEGMVLFSAVSIFYFTGIALSTTERPIAMIYKCNGDIALIVPRLELEHVQDHCRSNLNQLVCYPEYPGDVHPMQFVAETVSAMGLSKSHMAADGLGAPGTSGYKGPMLSEVCPDMQITYMPRLVLRMRRIKSPFEIAMIKESARWSNLAHRFLQDYTKVGLTELEVADRAVFDSTQIMLKTYGPDFKWTGFSSAGSLQGTIAGYRGQIGPHSYYPHSLPRNAIFKKGDTLVTFGGASVFGYNSELERVMFMGEPTKEQEHFFNLSVDLQSVAFNTIRPGIPCSDVDKAILRFYKENNIMHTWRHHTGHSMGLEGHESPFFDRGDHTILEPGMVFSVEPGIYVEGVGGFRMSDTILVTEKGVERITYYPSDLESLICPC